jgi:CheY-like chemotaxis protein
MRESVAMDLFASDVLVVEDDDGARRAIGRTLGSAGYMVTAAEDGRAAIAKVKRHPFGVIVTDIRMPVMNGLEFYEQLAAEYPDMSTRVLFVTAYLADDDVGTFIDRTGRPVLRKPFETQDLVGAVRKIIRESGSYLAQR